MKQATASDFRGGTIIRFHALNLAARARGRGTRYLLECDGRELFALRGADGACRSRRYTAAELAKLAEVGRVTIATEGGAS